MNASGSLIAWICELRTRTALRTGCPEWTKEGVRAALEKTQGPDDGVAAAACLAAGDPTLRLPSEAGFRSHWPKNASEGPRVRHNVPCVDHPGHDMPCQHRDHGGDMTPEQISAAAAEIRAQLRRKAKV